MSVLFKDVDSRDRADDHKSLSIRLDKSVVFS